MSPNCDISHNRAVTDVTSSGKSGAKRFERFMGSLLLGVALGLVGHHLITDAVSALQQSALRAEAPDRLFHEAVIEAPDRTFDFSAWEDEDLRYWETLPAGGVFGRLVSAEMGVDEVVVKGHDRRWLKRGPGWITYTDMPGPEGNVGISGHRTTYGAPFARIDRVEPGDTITFYSPYRRYRYTVTETLIVDPDDTWVVAPTERPMLTLTACHPPYSAKKRIVVRAELVGVDRLER